MSLLLEQKTIGTALKDPQSTQVVEIDPKWFGSKQLRGVYNAINEKPTADLLDWYATAHNDYHYKGTSDDLVRFKDMIMIGGTSYLKMYAKKLYKTYLVRQISTLAAKYAHVPAPETREAIAKYSDKMADLSVDRNSNHTGDACDELLHDLNNDKPTGVKTYNKLDFVLGGGLYKSCLLTIGAGTGVGKTALAVNLAVQILMGNKDVTVDYFTEEMTAKEIIDRVISRLTGVSSFKLRDPNRRIHSAAMKSQIATYAKELKTSRLHIYDTARSLTDIASIIKTHAGQLKPNKYVAMVDYIGLVDVPGSNDTPRYLQIGKITRTLKMLTSNYEIPIIELTQLNRNIAMRDDPKPTLSDIRESGSVEQDSNVVVLLYNDKHQKDVVHANIAKNRSGMTTEILYKFMKDRMTFKELGGQYEARNAPRN